MLHSQTFDCRKFRAHERPRTKANLPVTSASFGEVEFRRATSIRHSRSSHCSGERSLGGPCPRLATRPMLRQLCRSTRRLSAAYFCPYDTIRQSCVKELLHRDLNRGFLVDMKQSNLGSFFGSKAKNGEGKVGDANSGLIMQYCLDPKIFPVREMQSIQSYMSVIENNCKTRETCLQASCMTRRRILTTRTEENQADVKS